MDDLLTEDVLDWVMTRLPEDQLTKHLEAVETKMLTLSRTRDVLRIALNARRLAAEVNAKPGAKPSIASVEEPSATNGHRPGTREAIRTVFHDSESGVLTVSQVMQELAARGWLPEHEDPRKLVSSSISSLVARTRELEPAGQRATYRLVKKKLDPLASANGSTATASNRLFSGSADGEAASEDV